MQLRQVTENTHILRLMGEIIQTILTTKQIIYLPVYASLYSAHRTSRNTTKKKITLSDLAIVKTILKFTLTEISSVKRRTDLHIFICLE